MLVTPQNRAAVAEAVEFQENLDLAKQYGVTATPVLIIADEEGNKLEEFIGGMGITQNIRKMFDQYV